MNFVSDEKPKRIKLGRPRKMSLILRDELDTVPNDEAHFERRKWLIEQIYKFKAIEDKDTKYLKRRRRERKQMEKEESAAIPLNPGLRELIYSNTKGSKDQ